MSPHSNDRFREILAGLGHVLWRQPYEAVIALASLSGILELSHTVGSAAAALAYSHWLLYAIGILLTGGGALTLAGLLGVGVAFGDVGRVQSRRVEQCGQYLLAGALVILGGSALGVGSRGAITGALDLAIAGAAASRAVTISQVIARAGREAAL
jgi:hypothetical protein